MKTHGCFSLDDSSYLLLLLLPAALLANQKVFQFKENPFASYLSVLSRFLFLLTCAIANVSLLSARSSAFIAVAFIFSPIRIFRKKKERKIVSGIITPGVIKFCADV